eukprot:gene5463-5697_t
MLEARVGLEIAFGRAQAPTLVVFSHQPQLKNVIWRPAAATSLEDLTAMINSLVAAAAAGPTAVPYVSDLPAKKPFNDVPDRQLLLAGHASVKDALLDLAQALTAALAQPLTTPLSITSSSTSAEKSMAPSAAKVQQVLNDWADRVLPAAAGRGNSSRTLAKTLFKHLMAGSGPGSAGEGHSSTNPSNAPRMAAAAASTAMAGDASTGTAATAGSGSGQGRVAASVRHPKVAVTTLDTYAAGVPDDDDDGAPAPATGQPMLFNGTTALSPMAAAGAVSSDSNTFDPDAWEAAAEAAAAGAGAASIMGIKSAESPPDAGFNPKWEYYWHLSISGLAHTADLSSGDVLSCLQAQSSGSDAFC